MTVLAICARLVSSSAILAAKRLTPSAGDRAEHRPPATASPRTRTRKPRLPVVAEKQSAPNASRHRRLARAASSFGLETIAPV